MSWCKNNLIAFKLQYFLNFGGLASSSPFLQVFARQLGIGQVAVGLIFAVAPFVDLVVRPTVCAVADRRQATWTTFLLVLFVTTGCLTGLRWVPPLQHTPLAPSTTNLSMNSTLSFDAAVLNTTKPMSLVSDNAHVLDGSQSSVYNDMKHYQFWLFAALLLVAWTGVSTNQTMFDGITAKTVELTGADYGRQRLWGSIGYSSLAVLSGYLIDITGNEEHVAFRVGFYLTAALMTSNLLLCIFFIKPPSPERQRIEFSQISQLGRQWRVVAFSLCCMMIGVCVGLQWSFRIWYLDDLGREFGHLKSRMKLLQGLTYLVRGLVCEIPLMFMSGAILKRIGQKACLILSTSFIGIYLIVYSQLINPWYCLLVEPLSGAAFGVMYPAIASYACRLAPPGTVVTTQAMMAASFDGLGVGIGTLLSSYMYDRYGGRRTFLCFGIAALIAALIYFVASYVIDAANKRNQEIECPVKRCSSSFTKNEDQSER